MLTSPARAVETESAPTAWPAYRPFEVVVQRILPLSPHVVRVTFAGEQLEHLGATGLDQRLKLVLPIVGRELPDLGQSDPAEILAGSWYARWRALPEEARPPFRTYTVRAARPERRELDVDLVRHDPDPGGSDGPAARWLRRASVGDRLIIVGPDGRTADPTVGCDWRPGAARHVLLAGDETAMPSICAIVEALPPEVTAQAFIEVPSSADIQNLVPRGATRVAWLARDAGCETSQGFEAVAPHGELLQRAVRAWLPRHMAELATVVGAAPEPLDDVDVDTELLWDSPVDPTTGDFYAWIAGEAATVKALRRHLVSDLGVARSNVAFMGYWRRGRSEAQ